jgi:hypothetical protein
VTPDFAVLFVLVVITIGVGMFVEGTAKKTISLEEELDAEDCPDLPRSDRLVCLEEIHAALFRFVEPEGEEQPVRADLLHEGLVKRGATEITEGVYYLPLGPRARRDSRLSSEDC